MTRFRTRRVQLLCLLVGGLLAATVTSTVAAAPVAGDAVAVAAQPQGQAIDPGWIVTLDPDAEPFVIASALGTVTAASTEQDLRRIDDATWVLDAAETARAVRLPGVIDVRREQVYRLALTPDDTCYDGCVAGQWYLPAIEAPDAWDISTGDGSVLVAVLDSGVSETHVDLTGRVTRIAGCGLGPAPLENGAPTDWHGTHVAGVIGANTNNAAASAGVAWNVQLLDVRVLHTDIGLESDMVRGIDCAVAQGADVINVSVVLEAPSTILANSIAAARAAGVVVVAAAGNEGQPDVMYPAGYDGVIAVGATDRSNEIASFSTYGTWVDIAAPGTDILSTSAQNDFGVNIYSGTSFAAPVVAGAIAVLEAEFPTFSMDQLARRLKWTSRGYPGQGTATEFGLIDLEAALVASRRHLWQVTDSGQVVALGDAPHLGDAASIAGSAQAAALAQPIVDMAATSTGDGYWLVAADGGVFAFGDASFYGSTGNIVLNQPIVGMAPTPTDNGYWLVASDGGIFAFGDAVFHGSTGNLTLNAPIVAMASSASGDGYWLVASDGGIFAFGDAGFQGSMGGQTLNQPIVDIAVPTLGAGYWLVASDGGIFAFGGAPFLGSTGAISLNQPIGAVAHTNEGYALVASDGGVFNFGPVYLGSGANTTLAGSVVGAAAWLEGAG